MLLENKNLLAREKLRIIFEKNAKKG